MKQYGVYIKGERVEVFDMENGNYIFSFPDGQSASAKAGSMEEAIKKIEKNLKFIKAAG